jgi:hypothetical protein
MQPIHPVAEVLFYALVFEGVLLECINPGSSICEILQIIDKWQWQHTVPGPNICKILDMIDFFPKKYQEALTHFNCFHS